jgi:hypothetical protein
MRYENTGILNICPPEAVHRIFGFPMFGVYCCIAAPTTFT